jgi:5'(3')-deoxyribonucleotidase
LWFDCDPFAGVVQVSRKIVLLDVDGVVADLVTPVVAHLHKSLGLKCSTYTAKDVDRWDIAESITRKLGGDPELYKQLRSKVEELFNSQSFVASLQVYDGAIECAKRISSVANVYFVTAGRDESLYWNFERTKWLKEHFGGLYKGVVITEHKHLVQGDFFLDDNVDQVGDRYHKTGGTSCLLDRPWNDRAHVYYGVRVGSLAQFTNIVESHS